MTTETIQSTVTTTQADVDAATTKLREAGDTLSRHENAVWRAIRERVNAFEAQVTAEVKAATDDETTRLRTAFEAARVEHVDVSIRFGQERTDQPEIGTHMRLWDWPSTWHGYKREEMVPTDTYGVVEIRTDDTEFPENAVCLPEVGERFVRIFRKDGKRGLRFSKLRGSDTWRPLRKTDPDEIVKPGRIKG